MHNSEFALSVILYVVLHENITNTMEFDVFFLLNCVKLTILFVAHYAQRHVGQPNAWVASDFFSVYTFVLKRFLFLHLWFSLDFYFSNSKEECKLHRFFSLQFFAHTIFGNNSFWFSFFFTYPNIINYNYFLESKLYKLSKVTRAFITAQ